MNIALYVNKSDEICVHKDLYLIDVVSGYLRESCSIINPVIIIDVTLLPNVIYQLGFYYGVTPKAVGYKDDDNNYRDLGFRGDLNIYNANYAYIEEFGRYYFINNPIVINNKEILLNLSVDSIVTYWNQYNKIDCLVARNEFRYDPFLEDKNMRYKFYNDATEIDIDTTYADIKLDSGWDGWNYSIVYASESLYGNYTYALAPKNTNLGNPSYASLGITNMTKFGIMEFNSLSELCSEIVAHDSYATFIINLSAYPIYFYSLKSNSSSKLKLGNTTLNNVDVYSFKNQPYDFSPYFEIGRFSLYRHSYLDAEPYTTYELYLPYGGYVELKSTDILDSDVRIYYCIDFANTTTQAIIYNFTKQYVIKSLNINLGVQMSLNRSNNQELNDQKIQLGINSSIKGITSVVSLIGGVATSNPSATASGINGLISTGADVATKLLTMHERGQVASNSGIDGLYQIQTPRIKTTRMIPNKPTNYASLMGLPLEKSMQLINLRGFTQVADIHLDGVVATTDELDQIKSLLTSGIII